MRSYFFSADTQEDMLGWVRALSQSASMESDSSLNRSNTFHLQALSTEYQTFLPWLHLVTFFFLLHSSLQALFKLPGFYKDRWQQWISGLTWAPIWWRGSLPKAQAHQQDSEWTESAHWREDGDVALRAQGEAECASEKQQVVKSSLCEKGTYCIQIQVVYLRKKMWDMFHCWPAGLFSLQTEHPALLILTEEEPEGQTKKKIPFLDETRHTQT